MKSTVRVRILDKTIPVSLQKSMNLSLLHQLWLNNFGRQIPLTLVNQPVKEKEMLYFDLRPEQNAIQGDAPEGSDTFQWQLREEIAWAEIG